jgi:hypothetical protein
MNDPQRRSIVTTPAVEIAPIKCTFEPLASGSCCIALDPIRARPVVRRQNKLKFVSSIQTICLPCSIICNGSKPEHILLVSVCFLLCSWRLVHNVFVL